jgi:hypothetical protein
MRRYGYKQRFYLNERAIEMAGRGKFLIKAKNVTIDAGGKFQLPIPITSPNTELRWEYKMSPATMDIAFAVVVVNFGTACTPTDQVSEVVPWKRTKNAETGLLTGSCMLKKCGNCVMTWDNSYSWFRSKTITYEVEASPPQVKRPANQRPKPQAKPAAVATPVAAPVPPAAQAEEPKPQQQDEPPLAPAPVPAAALPAKADAEPAEPVEPAAQPAEKAEEAEEEVDLT